mgnify:CR=1 FL=1
MKKLLFFALILGNSVVFAQENCYQKYIKVFEVRGANVVEDGTYEDVIVTIRKGSFSDCLIGKVEVVNGNIKPASIHLTFVDGSYERLDRSYKYDEPVNIINGVSKTMVTKDDELINIMFVDAIKPKKKAFKRAPSPDFDL